MDVFNALADPTRREIMEMLASKGRLTASEICSSFNVSPPAISQHLKVLLEVKLVKMEKKAQQRIYELDAAGINEFGLWTEKLTRLWSQRYDALDRILAAEKNKILIINEIPKGKEENHD
jgi:DNA-binding transcriptional ArsR family regulator